MPTKVSIIEKIGEKRLLLPELINRGLAANSRLEYYLALLQAAQTHARAPALLTGDLSAERRANGIVDAALDHVVGASSDIGSNTLRIPAVGAIVKRLFDELRLMLEPVRVASSSSHDLEGRLGMYQSRLDDLIVRAPPCHDDQVNSSMMSAFTELVKNRHDTIHQLALDLHLELSHLKERVAVEAIDGAVVYDLTQTDRVLVRAFMKGVNQTAYLKFDHPGLGTTATRDGERLSIENDLGSSDAHVVIVHVTGLTAVLHYTDVHHSRAMFFQHLLRPYGLKWTTAMVAPTAEYEMIIGRYTAGDQDSLQKYLTFLGSRLVFLIDWNRARKRLTQLVSKSDAVSLLKWAADNHIGHRAFLQAGDLRLIQAAIQRTDKLQTRSASRLDEWLGHDAARSFLMSALRTTSSGLKANHSLNLIEDEIAAELLRFVQSADRHLLHGIAEHAAMVSTLAERLQRTLIFLNAGESAEVGRGAELARNWSARADQIALQTQRLLERAPRQQDLQRLLAKASGAADTLEETCYLLTLLPPNVDQQARRLLSDFAILAGGAIRSYVMCLEEARDLSATSPFAEIDKFLVEIDQLAEFARQAGQAQRAVTERLLRGAADFHDVYVVEKVARGLERATALVARCGVIVRDHVLNGANR
jgi:uncharacterized protein Yka (UPF0111/DUF47 family)